MKKRTIIFLLIPLLMTACVTNNGQKSQGGKSGNDNTSQAGGASSDEAPISVAPVDNPDEYDAWLNSWSKPGHLYFHYNRGNKGGYNDYCFWIWQNWPQDLEGSLWAFSANPKVSDKLTLQPMSTHWMYCTDVGKEGGNEIYVDPYGAIADVDLTVALKGGKTGNPTSLEGAEEIGFLLPQQNSMDGLTNWVSDGGRDIIIEDYADPANWRDVSGGKAIHIFVSTGALNKHSYYAGSGVPQAATNPIDVDTTGNYRSDIDAAYSNALGVSPTSSSFKDLGVGYQIFVASFRDSNGDGIGDIRGIIDSLDYLEDLGAEVLWLTPIQKSDSYHGYDISDYYAVDKRFGTVEDYRELLYKAHQRGMKVLMDLVLNHTSKGNVWFTNSQWGKTEGGINWRDVYTWKYETDLIEKYNPNTGAYDKITVKADAESTNPSWYRDGESRYYYYGKFGSGMPEINYLNASTRKLVIDMAKYWMSFGLDGFRLDAVKHIFMRDECYQQNDIIVKDVGSKTAFDDERGMEVTKGFDYSSNLTKNIMWWKEFAHGVKNDYPNCFLVGENFDGWGTRTASYYQALDSQFSFSTYYHIPAFLYTDGGTPAHFANKQAGETFDPFSSYDNVLVDDGQNPYSIPGGSRPDFIDGAFTSNHDVMRAINQVNGSGNLNGTTALNKVTGQGDQVNKAKIHAAITMLNPGVSWIYYGDELGMSSNTDEHIAKYGNENCEDIWYRQPFLWDDESIRPDYKSGQYLFELDSYNKTLAQNGTVNKQLANASSMLSWYKDLIQIKKMYPRAAKLSFDGSSGGTVLVLNVWGEGSTALKIYINVGIGNGEYTMNPGAGFTNVKTMGGAPTSGNIGAVPWSISVFKK